MSKLWALINALRYGSSLSDPAIHKNRQNLLNALIGLLGALAIFIPVEVSADDVANVAGGIATLVGMYNLYVTTASSDKIGVRASSEDSLGRVRSLSPGSRDREEDEVPLPSESRNDFSPGP